MAKCRDCVHWEVCNEYKGAFWGHKAQYRSPIVNASADSCIFYKDRSRFLKLPYKIGDVFYEPKRHQITEYQIKRIVLNEFGLHYEVILKKGLLFRSIITSYDIGKIVFDTREEAEQALKLKTGDTNA